MQKRQSANLVYTTMAAALANRSTCLDKQVGCIMVDSNRIIIASGYNGAPKGQDHCSDSGICLKEHYNDSEKCPSAHAEQNALIQCTNINQIHTVYITLSPCIVCVRMLMNTSCKRIVFLREHKHPEPKKLWKGEWIYYGL